MRATLAGIVLAGCTLTSQAPPLELRYFSPEPRAWPTKHDERAPRAVLRLGRITLAPHLHEAIVHRDSDVELAPYETLRWSDPPDAYVRYAVDREIFGASHVEQAVVGDAPVLDLEVAAFEEVRRGAGRFGRVELRYVVRDDHRVIARGIVATERPASNASIEAVVAAVAAALDASAAELASRVEAAICPPG